MAKKALTIEFYNGRWKNDNTCFTGHGEASMNKDAIWKFVAPASRIKKLTIPFSWDNGAAGTGFRDPFTFYFSLTKNGAIAADLESSDYRYAANEDSQRIGVPIEKVLDGRTGEVTVEFADLKLNKGETYYIRVNAADKKYESIKGFYRTLANTAHSSPTYEGGGGIWMNIYGSWKHGVPGVNIEGANKEGIAMININGEWKEGV